MIDKIMNYYEATKYVEDNGWDSFLELLQQEYPNYRLYSVSTSWHKDNQYICKAKGTLGDVIIGWDEAI